MLTVDLEAGDIVTRIGDPEHKYIVTSTRPSRGLKDYVTLMGPYGHADDVWVNYVKEKVGRIDLEFIFQALGSEKEKEKE